MDKLQFLVLIGNYKRSEVGYLRNWTRTRGMIQRKTQATTTERYSQIVLAVWEHLLLYRDKTVQRRKVQQFLFVENTTDTIRSSRNWRPERTLSRVMWEWKLRLMHLLTVTGIKTKSISRTKQTKINIFKMKYNKDKKYAFRDIGPTHIFGPILKKFYSHVI